MSIAMTRNKLALLVLVAACSALSTFLLVKALAPDQVLATGSTSNAEHSEDEAVRGPNGGRLLEERDFAVELVIAEGGIPPEFHLYGYNNGKQLDVDEFSASVELGRLGETRDKFNFAPEGDYLRGIGIVREPHSFDVYVTAEYAGKSRDWHDEK